MLTIRLQRTGRKKLPMYRVVAQEHSVSPSSGKVAAYLGHFNPHTKETVLNQEKIEFYLSNGAQPSNRAAKLLKDNKIKLPDWVEITSKPERKPKKEPAEEAASAETPAPEAEEKAEEKADEAADEVEAPEKAVEPAEAAPEKDEAKSE